jgi:hypothetical protein
MLLGKTLFGYGRHVFLAVTQWKPSLHNPKHTGHMMPRGANVFCFPSVLNGVTHITRLTSKCWHCTNDSRVSAGASHATPFVKSRAMSHRGQIQGKVLFVCVCVCVCARARACVYICVCACVGECLLI